MNPTGKAESILDRIARRPSPPGPRSHAAGEGEEGTLVAWTDLTPTPLLSKERGKCCWRRQGAASSLSTLSLTLSIEKGSRVVREFLKFCSSCKSCQSCLKNLLCIFLVALCFGGSIAFAQQKGKAKPAPVEKITDNVYRVGKALVDTEAHTVTCRGVINMDRGAIEYFAVTPRGKTHESLLRIDVRPLHLNVALLLAGLEPKNVLKRQGDKATPQGDPVVLRMRWRDVAGKTVEVNAEELVLSMPGEKPMASQPWVYTGSRILKEGFQADLEQSLVAVWHDPAALLDNRSPGGASNAYVVNTKRTPKTGTPVELIFKAIAPSQTATGATP